MKILKQQSWIKIIAILAYFCIGSILLLSTPHVGVADNGDFKRVTDMAGIQNEDSNRFTNSNRFFKYVPQGEVNAKYDYFSTQLLSVKSSKALSILLQKPQYDIHLLGLIYLLISAAGLMLFFEGIYKLFPKYLIFACFISVFIFSDIGYLAYYNSFYGEAAILSFLLLFMGCTLFAISRNRLNTYIILMVTVSAILFIGSKQANAPSGIIVALFMLLFMLLTKKKNLMIIILVSCITIAGFSVYCYKAIPTEIRMINQYHTVFLGILKDSDTPEKDLKDLGFDPKFAVLANTTYYEPNLAYARDGQEMKELFFDKFSYISIMKYYITHPKKFYNKLQITAAHSNSIRPSYLGNHQFSETGKRLSFEKRFSLWSTIKKVYFPNKLWFIFLYFLIYTTILMIELFHLFKKADKRFFIVACLIAVLIITAAMQFVIPILADGEGDIAKHLFYYTINYDLMLVAGLLYVAHKIWEGIVLLKEAKRIRKRVLYTSVATVCLAFLLFGTLRIYSLLTNQKAIPVSRETSSGYHLKNGAFIQFGNYKGMPLLWQVYFIDDQQINLVSYNILDKISFDMPRKDDPVIERKSYGSNNWEASSIRNWLNSDEGFLSGFSNEEKSILQNTKHKTLLSIADISSADGGDKLHYWSNPSEYLTQNYDNSFYKIVDDKVFMPDAKDIEEITKSDIKITKKALNNVWDSYWLRMPYSKFASPVRIVNTDGYIYHRDACDNQIGVVPCVSIPSTVFIVKGNGSLHLPYNIEY